MTTPILSIQDGELHIDGSRTFTGSAADLVAEIELLAAFNRPSLLVTPNVDHVVRLDEDPHFREIFREADLQVLDGMPLVLLAKALGDRGAQRHTGADLLPRIALLARDKGWRIAIAGGDPEVGRLAARKLNSQASAEVVTSIDFPMLVSIDDPQSSRVIEKLTAVAPDIVFLCLGSPKQELWYAHWQSQLPSAVYIGAGAAADFAANRVRRAPTLVQRLSLEWAWRLAQEPRRLAHRYLVRGPKFFSIAFDSLLKRTR